MDHKNKLTFIIILIGGLGVAEVSQAQEASEKSVSELYEKAGLNRRSVKAVGHQSTTPVNDSKKLPSAQRIIIPANSKTGTPSNFSTPSVPTQKGKTSLPSNKTYANPKYNKQRPIVKPAVPVEGK